MNKKELGTLYFFKKGTIKNNKMRTITGTMSQLGTRNNKRLLRNQEQKLRAQNIELGPKDTLLGKETKQGQVKIQEIGIRNKN